MLRHPFLCTGKSQQDFQRAGKTPRESERLKILARCGDKNKEIIKKRKMKKTNVEIGEDSCGYHDRGVYDHPSPMSCIHRIKMIILGKAPTFLKNQTDLEPSTFSCTDEYISSQIRTSIEIENEGSEQANDGDIISASIITSALNQPPVKQSIQADTLSSRSSEMLSSVSSSAIELPEQDSDGLEYIMGYIGRQCFEKFSKTAKKMRKITNYLLRLTDV